MQNINSIKQLDEAYNYYSVSIAIYKPTFCYASYQLN